MVWGMKNQDLIDCDQSDVDCTGKTVWNPIFDLNSEDVQIALLVSGDDVWRRPGVIGWLYGCVWQYGVCWLVKNTLDGCILLVTSCTRGVAFF